jgi:hypothetical protein
MIVLISHEAHNVGAVGRDARVLERAGEGRTLSNQHDFDPDDLPLVGINEITFGGTPDL